jgi:hypothetical protein
MDLRQHDETVGRGRVDEPVEDVVDLGLDHEAVRSRLLDH